MSTWGGIGEGLTAGMNARIALEEQRRREAQAQANADREFEFKQEQARQSQANADRSYEASRTDADRTFNESVRKTDLAQSNTDREFALKQDEAALKADVAAISADQAERELALKEQNQSWEDKMNEERIRGFRLANEKLDREERQAQMIEEANRESGREQLAAALYRVTNKGLPEQTVQYKDVNGQIMTLKARVLPQKTREQIFGRDGFFKDVQNVISYEDGNGGTIAALIKPDGTMQQITPEWQYNVYRDTFGKSWADEHMREVAEKKDLGMFAAKEQAKADAQERARSASDPYGKKRQIDAAVAILKADDASDGDRESALKYLASVFGNQKDAAKGGMQTNGDGPERFGYNAKQIAELQRRGYKWDASLYEWVKGSSNKDIAVPRKK